MASRTPLTFKAKIVRDDSDQLKGVVDGEVTADGLTLLRNKKVVFEQSVGKPARANAKRQVTVGEEGSQVKFEVIKAYG